MTDMNDHILEDMLRLRSYLIWRREGCPHGAEFDHWMRAKAEFEAEVRASEAPFAAEYDGPPLRKASAFVMPRLPISARPRKFVSVRLKLQPPAKSAQGGSS